MRRSGPAGLLGRSGQTSRRAAGGLAGRYEVTLAAHEGFLILSQIALLLRRLDRHYEVTLAAHEGFLVLSQIALLLRRLDRSQLFDTL